MVKPREKLMNLNWLVVEQAALVHPDARNRQSGEAIIQFVPKAIVEIEPKRIRQSLQDFFKRAPRRLAQPSNNWRRLIAMDETSYLFLNDIISFCSH
jgi:hypothetical protein